MRTTYRRLVITLLWAVVVAMPRQAAAQSEGIKVRGDWVIEVRNPDGSLAAKHEFRNHLTGEGQVLLAHVLAGGSLGAKRAIRLYGGALQDFRDLSSDTGLVTEIVGGTLVMRGQLTKSWIWNIFRVGTLVELCDSEGACGLRKFTETNIPYVPAELDQILQLKATISFSTAPQ